jgi:hypothetical protein
MPRGLRGRSAIVSVMFLYMDVRSRDNVGFPPLKYIDVDEYAKFISRISNDAIICRRDGRRLFAR